MLRAALLAHRAAASSPARRPAARAAASSSTQAPPEAQQQQSPPQPPQEHLHVTLEPLEAPDDAIFALTLTRPEARNALGRRMVAELREALVRLAGERDARCVLVRSAAPGVFCAGADLRERAGMTERVRAPRARGMRCLMCFLSPSSLTLRSCHPRDKRPLLSPNLSKFHLPLLAAGDGPIRGRPARRLCRARGAPGADGRRGRRLRARRRRGARARVRPARRRPGRALRLPRDAAGRDPGRGRDAAAPARGRRAAREGAHLHRAIRRRRGGGAHRLVRALRSGAWPRQRGAARRCAC
jgi:hypothetical protein